MVLESLTRLFRIAHFKTNFKADEYGVHPGVSPADSFGRPDSDAFALEIFVECLEHAGGYQTDYGDYMRCVNLYIIRLREVLRNRTPEIFKMIDEIQWHVQYSPDWCLESTRPWVLAKAMELKLYVLTHRMQIPKHDSVLAAIAYGMAEAKASRTVSRRRSIPNFSPQRS